MYRATEKNPNTIPTMCDNRLYCFFNNIMQGCCFLVEVKYVSMFKYSESERKCLIIYV